MLNGFWRKLTIGEVESLSAMCYYERRIGHVLVHICVVVTADVLFRFSWKCIYLYYAIYSFGDQSIPEILYLILKSTPLVRITVGTVNIQTGSEQMLFEVVVARSLRDFFAIPIPFLLSIVWIVHRKQNIKLFDSTSAVILFFQDWIKYVWDTLIPQAFFSNNQCT